MIRDKIIEPVIIKCNDCGKNIEISIYYKYEPDSSLHEDFYYRFGYNIENKCDCKCIDEQCRNEYSKASYSKTIKY